jgi:hypothetical protein
MRINWNDPYYGLMLGLGMIALIGAYIAFFGRVVDGKKSKHKKSSTSSLS